MGGTYRRVLAWEHDGVTRYGNGRKSMARNKPIDRRIKRREHNRIIREQLRLQEADAVADYLEKMRLIQEEENAYFAEMAAEFEYGRDLDDLYADDHPGYNDDYYDDYYDSDYYSSYDFGGDTYAEGVLTREGLTRLDLNAHVIQEQDAGKSLGDLLEDILKRKQAHE